MTDTRYIGSHRARPDAADKVTGKVRYIHDISKPGMLYGKIKRSEHAHARIVSIDTTRAERLPGVCAVITGYNTPPVAVGFLRDNSALKRDKVRHFRDEVAAVAAIDPDIAAAAIDLIEVEYEPLPCVFDPLEALEPGAPLVHEQDARGTSVTSNLVPMECGHDSGDVEAARRAAAHIVEGDYSVPLIQQSCLGTAGCIAEFDGNDNLTITAKTQIPFLAQRDFNRALGEMGLRGRNSRVIVPALGGAFGSGLDTHCYEFIAILLAHRTGRPVKILVDREEEFASLSPRQSARVKIAQGCDAQGRLLFRDIEVVQDNGAYASWGATFPTVMLLPVTSLYRVPNVRFTSCIVYTNNTYCQAMRGYGNPEVTWAIDSNLDDLADAAGIDALEMRRINCNEPGEVTPMQMKISTCGLRECLDKTAEHLDWSEKRGAGSGPGQTRTGVGMASLIHVGGSGRIYRSDASGLTVKLDDFGNVNVFYGGVEMGQGLHAVLTMAVADSFGVLPEHVHINQTDTATCPWDVGTHASRGAFMSCNAAILAAEKVRARIFSACEELFPAEIDRALTKLRRDDPELGVPDFDFAAASRADNFELRDSEVFLRDGPDVPWARVPLGRILRAMHFRRDGEMLTESVFYDPPSDLPDWKKGIGNMSACYTYGVQGVEVEVDEDTGEVAIKKLVSALDVGKVLNPPALRGQVYGGIAQGIGYALYEEVKTEQGRILNPNFTDYKLPTACEMDFPIVLEFIETDEPVGPFGAKGAGEPGLVPTAPAIANAIQDAIGVRIRDLPITPEKILAALAKRG
ncbi:MAG: 4-hydroxybenzoyl-CoA reductase [Planctomycetes bacterium]|nr:4-hydroxybenzoyl-CoA reductase [Planctomycetota bacterium]